MLEANELNRLFVYLMQQAHLIANLECEVVSYEQDGLIIPATVSDYRYHNCYVVSPITQTIYYSRDELPKVSNKLIRLVCLCMTYMLEWPFRFARLDRTQVINNLCLSTNFYSHHWSSIDCQALREKALHRFPNHALMMRSLNYSQSPELLENLSRDGWISLVNRQIYLLKDFTKWRSKRCTKIDLKLLRNTEWEYRELAPDNQELMIKAEQLYNQLYLDKYSHHNIQFTAEYFSEFTRNGLLKLFGLFHKGQMLGVVGVFGVDDIHTVPVVGYDTAQPNSMALYRRLVLFTSQYAADNNCILNQSSGAPAFKKHRGAEPEIEYNFVYIKHLPLYQRAMWRVLSWISHKIYKPILEKFEL